MKPQTVLGLALATLVMPAFGQQRDEVPFRPEEYFFQLAPDLLPPAGFEILFNPQQPIEDRIIREIDAAKTEVLINHYILTSSRVLDALSRAMERHCIVAVVLDAAPQVRDYVTFDELARRHIPYGAIRRGRRAWNNAKYVIVDREVALTGTADLTNAARENDEVLLVMKEPSIVIAFYNHFVRTAFPALKAAN